MTTDKGLDVGEMKDIAQSVAEDRHRPDPVREAADRGLRRRTRTGSSGPSGAETIWKAIRKDKPLPGTKVPSGTTTRDAVAHARPRPR